MPRIGEMYPPKYLSYTDLPPNEMLYVTITGVVLHQATASTQRAGPPQPANQYTRAPHQQGVQTDWLLWFKEFPKPLFLKKSKAAKIATILGTDVTEEWAGRRLGIYRGVWSNGGKAGEGLMIDDRPAPPASTAIVHAATGNDPKRLAPIPLHHVERFRGLLAEQGKSWDEFQLWLKRNSADAFAAVYGEPFDAIPGLVLPWMRHYLDALKGPPPAEVIDPITGEVQTGAQTAAPPLAALPQQRTVERFVGRTGDAAYPPPPGASGGAPGGASVPGPFSRPPAAFRTERPSPKPSHADPIDFKAGLPGHEPDAPSGHVPDGYTPVTEDDIPF